MFVGQRIRVGCAGLSVRGTGLIGSSFPASSRKRRPHPCTQRSQQNAVAEIARGNNSAGTVVDTDIRQVIRRPRPSTRRDLIDRALANPRANRVGVAHEVQRTTHQRPTAAVLPARGPQHQTAIDARHHVHRPIPNKSPNYRRDQRVEFRRHAQAEDVAPHRAQLQVREELGRAKTISDDSNVGGVIRIVNVGACAIKVVAGVDVDESGESLDDLHATILQCTDNKLAENSWIDLVVTRDMHGTGQIRAERRLCLSQLTNCHLSSLHAERFLEISCLGKVHSISRIGGDDVGSISTKTGHVGVVGVGMSCEGDTTNKTRVPQRRLTH